MAVTCITCQHWQPKQTEAKLVRLGFAQCEKKTKGHSLSATAPACTQHKPVDDKTAQARAKFMEGVGR